MCHVGTCSLRNACLTLQIVILLHESQEWRKLVREEGGALARPDQGDCARHRVHLRPPLYINFLHVDSAEHRGREGLLTFLKS